MKAAVLVGRGNGGAGTGHAASMPRKLALVCQPNTSVLARIGLRGCGFRRVDGGACPCLFFRLRTACQAAAQTCSTAARMPPVRRQAALLRALPADPDASSGGDGSARTLSVLLRNIG
jgi:hypothetical protein